MHSNLQIPCTDLTEKLQQFPDIKYLKYTILHSYYPFT